MLSFANALDNLPGKDKKGQKKDKERTKKGQKRVINQMNIGTVVKVVLGKLRARMACVRALLSVLIPS